MADSNQALAERKKYLSAFNRTMVNIWKEQIIRLGIIDTGRLLESVMVFKFKADGKMMDITLSTGFPRVWTVAGLRYRQGGASR